MSGTGSSNWSGVWEIDSFAKDKGVWVTGRIVSTRFHTVTTKDALHRYVALLVKVENAFERFWNKFDNEQTPDWRKPERSQNPALTHEQLLQRVQLPGGLLEASVAKQSHPQTAGVFEFWSEPDPVKAFKAGQDVLLRTNGGFVVKFIQNKDLAFGTGKDDPLMNRVGKVMSTFDEPDQLAHEKLEGCNDDEWED
eukprot:TRINITY_DN8415_c0_g1_i1.p1 TRINITY_DN8415_c0_g1~~TRINITY_DN8415_c0_g1_i1.p1  ORF type:complete len:195 (+),score=17.66 TRINITY_DN8415_c0_g1_i1:109-693(+)